MWKSYNIIVIFIEDLIIMSWNMISLMSTGLGKGWSIILLISIRILKMFNCFFRGCITK